MITTKEIKIKRQKVFTSEYIEEQLAEMGYDVLRWAITDYDEEFYILNISMLLD